MTTRRPAPRVWLAALALIVVVTALVILPVQAWLTAALGWLEGAGPLGALLFGLLYVAAVVGGLPASLLTLGAGYVYGPFLGAAIVWPSATIGAVIAFLLGRSVLRSSVEAKLSAHPKFAALDDALADGGLSLVTLVRLSPAFPFNVINYAFGVTSVSLRDYALGSLVGMLPGTFMYVYLGSTLGSLQQVFSGSVDAGAGGQVLRGLGLVATVAVTVLVTRRARAALDARLAEDPSPVP